MNIIADSSLFPVERPGNDPRYLVQMMVVGLELWIPTNQWALLLCRERPVYVSFLCGIGSWIAGGVSCLSLAMREQGVAQFVSEHKP